MARLIQPTDRAEGHDHSLATADKKQRKDNWERLRDAVRVPESGARRTAIRVQIASNGRTKPADGPMIGGGSGTLAVPEFAFDKPRHPARSPCPWRGQLGRGASRRTCGKRGAPELTVPLKGDPHRWVSNLGEVLGPYRQPQDVARYQDGLRCAGHARITDSGIVASWHKADINRVLRDVRFRMHSGHLPQGAPMSANDPKRTWGAL
jgi:hypothetical protein